MKVVFLDRDGVINRDTGYVYLPDDFEFLPGVFDACSRFRSLGYELIIVTNQSGIGRKFYSEEDFHFLTRWMISRFLTNGVEILGVFFCPHVAGSLCDCRKPMPGLFLEARDKYGIDMEGSWMIGDKETDIEAATAAGIQNTILVSSCSDRSVTSSKASFFSKSIQESQKFIN